METSNDFGLEVLKYRSRHRLSQADLARILGVSTVTVLRWEKGQRVPIQSLRERFRELLRKEKE